MTVSISGQIKYWHRAAFDSSLRNSIGTSKWLMVNRNQINELQIRND